MQRSLVMATAFARGQILRQEKPGIKIRDALKHRAK
jgi:hypothetical protein